MDLGKPVGVMKQAEMLETTEAPQLRPGWEAWEAVIASAIWVSTPFPEATLLKTDVLMGLPLYKRFPPGRKRESY